MRPIFTYLLLFIWLGNCGSKPDIPKEVPLKGRQLSFTTQAVFKASKEIPVSLAEARTETERNQGLMDVYNLQDGHGMIFYFTNDRPLTFWMANTPLSLDIIFINVKKEIVRIHHSTKPFSETQYESGVPARYVIEVPAGFCQKHDITEGQLVEFPL